MLCTLLVRLHISIYAHSMLLGFYIYDQNKINPKMEQYRGQKKIIVHNLQKKFLHESWPPPPPHPPIENAKS
jgi:hypothetical protein